MFLPNRVTGCCPAGLRHVLILMSLLLPVCVNAQDLDPVFLEAPRGTETPYEWSLPALPLNDPDAFSDAAEDRRPSIAFGEGFWVAAWHASGFAGADNDIITAFSEDGGATWSDGIALNNDAASDAGTDQDANVKIAFIGNPSPRFIAVWEGKLSGGGQGLVYSISTDGASWSNRADVQSTDLPTTEGWFVEPSITNNGNGTWMITAGANPVYSWTSTDNGATWLPAKTVHPSTTTDEFDIIQGDVMTDSLGLWIVAAVTVADDEVRQIIVSKSSNNGSAWSDPVAITDSTSTAPLTGKPQLQSDKKGKWFLVWQSAGENTGLDGDIYFSTSRDNGETWTAPAPVQPDADSDTANDTDPQIATDSDGIWIITWDSNENGINWSGTEDLGLTWRVPAQLAPAGSFPYVESSAENPGKWITTWSAIEEATGTDADIFYSTTEIPRLPQEADLAIELLGVPEGETAYTCGVFNVQFLVTNDGPRDASTVSFTANFDTLVEPIAASSNAGDCEPSGQTVNCDLGTVPVGGEAVVTVQLRAAPPFNPGPVSFEAFVQSAMPTDPDSSNDFVNSDVTLLPASDVTIDEASTNPDPGFVGIPLAINATITNHGPQEATTVVIGDELPEEFVYVASEASKGTCVYQEPPDPTVPQRVVCTIGTLAVDESVTVTITVVPTEEGTFDNSIYTTTDTDCDQSNNVLIQQIEILPTPADLYIISKRAFPDPGTAGSLLSYTISVANNGPGIGKDVIVTDVLPPEVEFVSAGVSKGTYSYDETSHTLYAMLGDMTIDNPATPLVVEGKQTVVVAVRPLAPGEIYNHADIFSLETGDQNLGNNSIDTTTTINGNTADVAVTNSASPAGTIPLGALLTYTVTATNNGPMEARDVRLVDQLPATVNIISATSTRGTVSIAGKQVDCFIGTMSVGETVTMTIDVQPRFGGTISSTATVTSFEPDPNTGNNTATVQNTVSGGGSTGGQADLEIVKSAPPVVPVGIPFNYTCMVTNNGPDTAIQVRMNDALPTSLTLVSATSTHGTPAALANNNVTCLIGPLTNGATATITMTVIANIAGPLSNTASVISSTGDPNTTNNFSTFDNEASGSGGATCDLEVTGSASPSPAISGQNLTYTITARNNGTDAATSVSVTHELPPNMAFVSATPTVGTFIRNGSTILWIINNMTNGASETMTVVVTPQQGGSTVSTAVISGAVFDPVQENNTATITVQVNGESVSGTDMAGEWTSIVRRVSRNRVIARTKLRLQNKGTERGRNVGIEFYLSLDNKLDAGDLLITKGRLGTFRAGQARSKSQVLRLPPYTPTIGKYFIAVIKLSGNAVDANPADNIIVSQQLPFPD